VRRDLGRESKASCSIDEFVKLIPALLDEIHDELFARAKKLRDENITDVTDLVALEAFYKDGGFGFVRMDSSLIDDAEYERVKKDYALTSRCMPFADEGKVLVGKAY